MALAHIGANAITDITSTTETGAIEASKFYDETVKEVGREHAWNCLMRSTTLRLFGSTPAFEWSYRYALPSDFIRMDKMNGVQVSEPQDIYEIAGFYDSLVTNDEFKFSTYDTDESAELLDDWTVVSGSVTRDTTSDEMIHTDSSKVKQTINCLAKGDHTMTAIIASNTGSGAVSYIVEDENGRQLASTTTAAGFTGTTSLNFYCETNEAVLFVNCGIVGAVVDHTSVKVTCADAPDHVLLTDVDSARIRYVANITDVSAYEPKLVEVIALLLASKLATPIRQEESLKFSLYQLYKRELAAARRIDGNEAKRSSPVARMVNDSDWVKARRSSTNG